MAKPKQYFSSDSNYACPVEALEGRRGPKARPLMAFSHTSMTQLSWSELPENRAHLELSLSFVVEPAGKGSNRIQVFVVGGTEAISEIEVFCSDPYQVLSIALPADAVTEQGTLTLNFKLVDEGLLWLFAPDQAATGGLECHVPHIVDGSQPQSSFMDRLASLASIQTFSWKEGCVLDALQAFAATGNHPEAQVALRAHLDYYNFSGGDLEYETPRGFSVKNELDTIETTLPFAHVARIDSQHPWVDLAIEFWQGLMDANGQVQDEGMISSEGAYTVAYPMTLIAKLRGQPQWEQVAENLLIETFERLVQPDGIYLRHYTDDRRTHRNWVRGLCWLLLGHVQVLKLQSSPSAVLQKQLITLAEFAARYQLENGLWACFVDEPEVAPDTSGSTGVAAAFAMGVNAGLLPDKYMEKALNCREAARACLTTEGYLAGCSQSNKGGEALQRSDYRVTLPYALGLFGLLEAATLDARTEDRGQRAEDRRQHPRAS